MYLVIELKLSESFPHLSRAAGPPFSSVFRGAKSGRDVKTAIWLQSAPPPLFIKAPPQQAASETRAEEPPSKQLVLVICLVSVLLL